MSLKRTEKNTNGNGVSATEPVADSPKYRDNVEINAKIDAYIQANPKEWNYIQGLPRERLERMLVLQNVNKIERRERHKTTQRQSRVDGGVSQARQESACGTAGESDGARV